MTTELYSQPDNHRQALTGTVQRCDLPNPGLVLVGRHGQAKILLLGEDRHIQPTLSGVIGENVRVSGIWKRGILHFWPDNFSAVDALPAEESPDKTQSLEEPLPEMNEEPVEDTVLQMISNMEKVPHVEKLCPKCNVKSKHFAKYCWGCGFSFLS